MSGLFVDNDGKMSWKKLGYRARSAFAVCLSLAVLIGGGWFVYHKVDQAYTAYKTASDYPGPGGKDVTVVIPKGATLNQIGNILHEADVVKSSKAFVQAADDSGDTSKFQAGEYKLRQQIPAATAAAMLLDPKNKVLRQFTVIEGQRVSDVLVTISKKTGVKLADLQKLAASKAALGLPSWATNPNAPEGFLFPNTYEYDSTPTAAELLTSMTAQFKSVTNSINFTAKAKQLGYTPLQVLTVAAIVQAEVPAKYQPQVAGIIYNRIKKGMPLGLDTSLHYMLNIPMNKPLPAGVTSLNSKYASNPYNTYTHTGFMPGPMNSPGKSALQAAANPTSSDNLYFVTVNLKTGETKFSKTLAEHNTYVKQFEAWCKANPVAGCPTA